MDGDTEATTTVCSKDLSADVVIVGGGAAGLATAIFCARLDASRSILILDGASKLGAKILVSGGGRCNVTNKKVTREDFWGGNPNVIRRTLSALSAQETVEFFGSIGVELREEGEIGKLFPVSNKAQTVLDALLAEANRLNIRISCNQRVTNVSCDATGFLIEASDRSYRTKQLVLATGGQSLPKTGSDGFGYELARKLGHTLIARTPALDPLKLDGDFHSQLSGISHRASISVARPGEKSVTATGELLWTHFGISGPVALDISRHWHRANIEGIQPKVSVSLLPDLDMSQLESWLLDFGTNNPKAQIVTALCRLLPNRVAQLVLKVLGVDATMQMSQLAKAIRRKVIAALLEWPIEVTDGRGYTFAEATAGGVSLAELNPGTLESRKCPSLYLVGEILDVDGRLGGFNFQWAWSSAWIAGTAIARKKHAV